MAGRSPIRLSPIGHSPMAKVRGYIGESPLYFRQLAKFQWMCWRKNDGLSPIGEIPEDALAKIHCTFTSCHKAILIQYIRES